MTRYWFTRSFVVVFFNYVRLRTFTGGLNVNSHCGTDNKVIIIPYVTEGVIVITTMS